MYPLNSCEVAGVVACTVAHDRKVQARCGRHDYTSKGLGGANGTTTEGTFDYVDKAVLEIQNHKPDGFLSYAGYTNVRNTGLSSQAKHWGSNLPRLERIKALLDPNDVFSTPLGIKPRA